MAERKTDDPRINALFAKQLDSKTKRFQTDLKWLLSNASGRRLMAHWFTKFGLFHDVFDTNGMVMAKKAAEQKAAQSLFLEIRDNVGWKAFSQIMEEDVAEQERLKKEFDADVEKLSKGV